MAALTGSPVIEHAKLRVKGGVPRLMAFAIRLSSPDPVIFPPIVANPIQPRKE